MREAQAMQGGYSLWMGQPVVLQVAAGEMRVPLRGVIVGESDDAVRFRIGDGWDVDIYKNMVLAVREPNEVNIV